MSRQLDRRSTDIDLRDYVDIRFEALEKSISAALHSQEKYSNAMQTAANAAIEKADKNTTEWKATSNEWRQAMNDRERNFFPRLEAEKEIAGIIDRLVLLERKDIGMGERRQGSSETWKFLATGLGILLAIASAIAAYLALRP